MNTETLAVQLATTQQYLNKLRRIGTQGAVQRETENKVLHILSILTRELERQRQGRKVETLDFLQIREAIQHTATVRQIVTRSVASPLLAEMVAHLLKADSVLRLAEEEIFHAIYTEHNAELGSFRQ